ncbi:hypothetical protein Dimus_002644 [Dionaea muscipula]
MADPPPPPPTPHQHRHQIPLNPYALEFHPNTTTLLPSSAVSASSPAPIRFFPPPQPPPPPPMFSPRITYSYFPYYTTQFPQTNTTLYNNLPSSHPQPPHPSPYPATATYQAQLPPAAGASTCPRSTQLTTPPHHATPRSAHHQPGTAAEHCNKPRYMSPPETVHDAAAPPRWPRSRQVRGGFVGLGKSMSRSGFSGRRSNNSNTQERPMLLINNNIDLVSHVYDDNNNNANSSSSRSRSSSNNRANYLRRQVRSYCERMGKKPKTPLIPIKADGTETTVMIRNIPNQYMREDLIKFLDNFCKKENENHNKKMMNEAAVGAEEAEEALPTFAFDFVYLPVDFGTHVNRGFAFVNFTSPLAVWKLHLYNSSDQRWEKCDSDKLRDIVCAKIQGKRALMDHFEKSVFTCSSPEYLPVCFSPPRDGGSDKGIDTRTRTIGKRTWKGSCSS